ncbi:glycosyl transferase group 1 [Thioalkalivibrio sp. K90mix]|uniref:glycosyltransferase n=1 Tax=Thioalkalivibrio sp. (strain K90mix) TaxID=396595 RepID=UPI000195A498|nr:glycosyltransferase [Thioalkalivibrio sp. K90mix]ADC71128.1 glycosyl transferase group 1 [Thioalkalivibrio sp. K90mix]
MKILHVINGLGQGGAERQLGNLLRAAPDAGAVFALKEPGVMAGDIRAQGIPVYTGRLRNPLSTGWIAALRRALAAYQPDGVMGWMYHGNLAASLTRRLGYQGPVFWNVRHSVHDLAHEKRGTRWVIRTGAWLSRYPARIVYNSATAAAQHEALGFAADRRVVLPNGFDLARFHPAPDATPGLRAQLGIGADTWLLGMVGRAHPMKNHAGLVAALAHLVRGGVDVHCVMVGTGVSADDNPLAQAIREHGMDRHVTLLPPTPEPEALYPGLDLLVLPSRWGEGFPNVVGEAMACGRPAVVTDIGDAARVVGSTGFVAASPEPQDLADAIVRAIGQGRERLHALGGEARARMESHYALEAVAARYQTLFRDAMAHTAPVSP